MAARVESTSLVPSRDGAPSRSLLEAILVLAAVLVAAGGAVALLAPAIGRPGEASSVGQTGPIAASIVLLAGTALATAGTAGWIARSDRVLALIAFAAAAAWLAAELAGSASVAREARSLGALVAPFFAPLIVHLPMRTLRTGSAGRGRRWFLVALYVVVAAAAFGRAVTYDPFFDIHCAPTCDQGDNVLVVDIDVRLAALFASLGLAASSLGGIVLTVWALQRLARARPGRRRQEALVLVPSMLVGLGLSASTVVRLAMVPDRPADPNLLLASVALACGVCALGLGTAMLVMFQLRRSEALHRLVDALEVAAGSPSLRVTLAHALGDERLRVAYPVEPGVFIDEGGEPVDEPRTSGLRGATAITRGDELIALVEHDADVDPDLLDREIGAAARLAVDNERLEATVLARLRELRASRARIVAAGDAARSRLERDLHDGAQQRLLALSFELRLASAALAGADVPLATKAAIERAVGETDLALSELRDLAHGIHPVVLSEDGLDGALASLADTASVPLVVRGDEIGRCDTGAELAAYVAVVEAMRQAEVHGVERVEVSVRRTEGTVQLSIAGPAGDDPGWVRVEDRVSAADGRLAPIDAGDGATVMQVELPCA